MTESRTAADGGPPSLAAAVPDVLRRPGVFREIVAHSTDGIAILDTSGRYLYQNPAHRELLGFSDADLREKTPAIHLGEEAFAEIAHALAERGSFRGEAASRTRAGRELTIDLSAFAVLDAEGKPTCFVGIKRDVSGRKTDERALAESEERYRLLFEQDSDGIMLEDAETLLIEDVNPAGLAMLGYERDELIGLPVTVVSAEQEKTRLALAYLLEGDRTLRVPSRYLRRRDGSTFPAELTANVFVASNGRRKLICAIRDITERRRFEREILDISGREQRRIGQDLHDGLGQELTGIAFLGKSLERDLRARGLPEADRVANLVELLHHAIAKTRKIASGLFPADLQTGGLVAALSALAKSLPEIYGIDCRFESGEPVPELDREPALHLYRIAQEATTNAVKHGQARAIHLTLEPVENAVVLRVEDDGCGIDPDATEGDGMGLQIMRYRAGLMGACLDVGPREGGSGTAVVCKLPSA